MAEVRVCGDCNKWMCSSLCPREMNVAGHSKGPSCSSLACPIFESEQQSAKTEGDKNE